MTTKHGIKDVAVGRSDIFRLTLGDLHVKDGWNCRDHDFDPADPDDLALANSIAQIGVREPLTVQWDDGKAYITNGHRRFRASLHAANVLGAEIKSVPVQTEPRYSSEAEHVLSQIVRNAGKPLTPLEKSRVFKRLLSLGWSEKDIATQTGVSETYVRGLLELQAAPAAVTELVRSGAVSASLATAAIRQHGTKAADKLQNAVETAKAGGKKHTTAKHMERKPAADPLSPVKAAFEASDIDNSGDETVLISMPVASWTVLRSLLKL